MVCCGATLIVVAVVVWLVACCAPLELRRSDTPRIIRMWMCMGVGCTGAALGSRYSVLASVNTARMPKAVTAVYLSEY